MQQKIGSRWPERHQQRPPKLSGKQLHRSKGSSSFFESSHTTRLHLDKVLFPSLVIGAPNLVPNGHAARKEASDHRHARTTRGGCGEGDARFLVAQRAASNEPSSCLTLHERYSFAGTAGNKRKLIQYRASCDGAFESDILMLVYNRSHTDYAVPSAKVHPYGRQ